MFHDFLLYLVFVLGVLDYFLDDSAAVTVETDEEKLFFDEVVDDLFVFFSTDLDVFLHHVVSEFVVDQFGKVRGERVEYLVFDGIVSRFQDGLHIT